MQNVSQGSLNSLTKDPQIKVRILEEQHGMKPTSKQTNTEARIAALEAQLGVISYTEEGDFKETEGEPP